MRRALESRAPVRVGGRQLLAHVFLLIGHTVTSKVSGEGFRVTTIQIESLADVGVAT